MRANPFAERATEERVKFTPSFIEFVLMKCLEAKKDPLFILKEAGLSVCFHPGQAAFEARARFKGWSPNIKAKPDAL